MNEPLLQVDDLRVRFWTSRGIVYAVNGVSFDVRPARRSGWWVSPAAARA